MSLFPDSRHFRLTIFEIAGQRTFQNGQIAKPR
jgi:hypothetical protein